MEDVNPYTLVLFGIPYSAALAFVTVGFTLAVINFGLKSRVVLCLMLTPLLTMLLVGLVWLTARFAPGSIFDVLPLLAANALVIVAIFFIFLVAFVTVAVWGWAKFLRMPHT